MKNTKIDIDNKGKVACDICGILVLEVSLKQHIDGVHSTEVLKCDLCDYSANSKVKIMDHRKRHFREISKCPECGKMVKSLKRHFRRMCGRKEEVEKHQCDRCEKSFTFKAGLTRHIKTIHEKIKDYQCSLCNYQTYTNFNLK